MDPHAHDNTPKEHEPTNHGPITLQIIEAYAGCDSCKRCDPLRQGLCCQTGSGLAIDKDITAIAAHLGISEQETLDTHFEAVQMYGKTLHRPRLIRTQGKPYGPCHLFKPGKGCTIYSVRPTQCRIGTWGNHSSENHEWFIKTHAVDHENQEAVRQWRSDTRHRRLNNATKP